MNETLNFVRQHTYSVLFFWVLAEQGGIPVPAVPILLAAGALSAGGEVNLAWTILLAAGAALLADSSWYYLGLRKGMKVLNFLCKISLEPDSCVRATELAFEKSGARSLLVAKFVPGLSTASPPLAGIFHMPVRRFLIYDGLGTLFWVGSFVVAGRLFSRELDTLAVGAANFGSLMTFIVVLLAAYVGWKFLQRRLFLRRLRIARIEPEELKQMLDAGELVMIVDLRHEMDFASEPNLVRGALRMSPDELHRRNHEIPRDRDIILYCT